MTVTFATTAAVAAALDSPDLRPPPPPGSVGHGATAQLRAEMARFSDRDCHGPRRAEVVSLIDSIVPAEIQSVASDETGRVLAGKYAFDLVADIAFRVPTETMLGLLGLRGDRSVLVADVRAVVEVIGRGVPASARSDAATERLLAACRGARGAPAPIASLLYQTYDATAALLIETVLARHRSTVRAPAITRTGRVAVASTSVGDVAVRQGETVVLDLGSADLEFGAGPHECPGRSVAEAIVEGIIASIDTAGFVVHHVSCIPDGSGRASSVTLGLRS